MASGAAFAQEFAREGLYIGGGWNRAFENFDDGGFSVDDSRTINIFAGYRLNASTAIEFEYEDYDDFDLTLGAVRGSIDGWSLVANSKTYLSTERIQPYILLGVGVLDIDLSASLLGTTISEDGTGVLLQAGGGVDIYVTDHIAVELEGAYKLPGGDVADLDMWTLGGSLVLRF